VRRVGLISCGAAKRAHGPWAAADLYTGSVFRMARRYVEATCDEWAILSAEHALLMPDEPVMPYERRIVDLTVEQRRAWGLRVGTRLRTRWSVTDTLFVVTAGKPYRSALPALPNYWCPWDDNPGLGMGRQLAWMRQQIDAAEAA
jgi:hypothetical protein